jgi:hypothetical protein
MKKTLFSVSAVLELGAGLALLVFPSDFVTLLIGGALEGSAALSVARVGGTALLALGLACWLARNDSLSGAASAIIIAMLMYNLGIATILGMAGVQDQTAGILLWPAVIVHSGMAVWCLVGLQRKPD